ncbi:MAG: ATP-binding protein [Gammaproteobacteria bacterium]|nr:ATP-binding protein [Gammaproteobacteria bacterium]
MNQHPAYFERIRQRAAQRWEQLEQDPELAGPWHQLFKQVQSPRHILSELLQNADDAGATEASIHIEDQVFTFEHDGEDFSEEHFASLCRFGYSNKRSLHTIGFRGVGFKSVFSLGDQVELITPSLSICFHGRRFTEPKWLPTPADTRGRTRVRVKISDQHRQREVEKNLEDWVKSPVSLLFFKNIRRVRIGEREVHWGSRGPGPIPESEWMALSEHEEEACLLIRSEAEAFLEEALAEIRQERMLGTEEDGEFPPCTVEIVHGAKGRLYVVLPTGVETELPFACNAPFIQDPARLKIKDPETSPTNRWLLKRAGKLVASAMLDWLNRAATSPADRAGAYGLFPDIDRECSSLEGVCGTIVEETFAEAIDGKNLLLTEDGQLTPAKRSVIISTPILDVWAPEQAAVLLDEEGRPPLCQYVEAGDRKKLLEWGIVDEIDKQKLIGILQQNRLPKPNTWRQLLNLWTYVAPEITGFRYYKSAKNIRIVPVQGRDVLYAASEVVRLGEKKLLQSEDDWEFLAKYLIVLNHNWPRFLAEQRRAASEEKPSIDKESVEGAYAVLEEIGLHDTSDVSKVIDQVAAEFFSQESISLQECIQLAQIAAKLGAHVGEAFRYVARDRHVRSADSGILFDENGALEELLPEEQRETQLLHPAYSEAFKSCSEEEWLRWVASGSSGLLTFIPFAQKRVSVYGKWQIEQEARKRGLQGDLSYPYKSRRFVVEDWDFEEICWQHWETSATEDERLWVKLAERISAQREAYWARAKTARLLQVATTGNTKSMTFAPLLPSWALRLREQPCLPDTRGIHRKPDELLRRTPETESLMDVELFVHGRLDREATRPLLDLLGVRSTPTGPDRLLDCLRALAKAEKPPVHEVEKWYRRLDQMMETCSTTDLQKIKQAFRSEKLILAQDGIWTMATAVFLSSDDEDVPDAAVIRPSVSELALWRKIDVAGRPTADLAIEWMKALPSRKTLSQEDARRVRALLVRHPIRIWEECKHWINLAGEWAPVDDLDYALTMQSLILWRHLHQWVKQKTADLQRLPAESTSNPPFLKLPPLSAHVEERFQKNPIFTGPPVRKEWLHIFGAELRRVELDADEETLRVRTLAESLAETDWIETPGLEIIPYIGGTPAGTPRQADVVWLDHVLYVKLLARAKLARRVPEEIGKAFARPDIKAALDYSFERSPEDIREYLEENFKLAPPAVISAEPVDAAGVEDAGQSCTRAGAEDAEDVVEALPSSKTEEKLPTEVELAFSPDEPVGDAEEKQPVIDDINTPEPRPRLVPKPARPSIMERFAKAQGFRKASEDRFFHENGSSVSKASGARFPWEHRTAAGDLVRYYWPKDHCLEREPLQLEADVWSLIEQHPETYALILSDIEGEPVEVTGARLRGMREEGKVTLFPASYRLVYDHDRHT